MKKVFKFIAEGYYQWRGWITNYVVKEVIKDIVDSNALIKALKLRKTEDEK